MTIKRINYDVTSSLPAATIQPRAEQNPQVAVPPRSFLRDIRIDYGSSELLSRLFIAADAALSEHGITLSFASFDELVGVNEANRATWAPLNPTFHPRNGNVAPDCAFALLGRDASGQVVTAQATRIFDWQGTNLKTEAESLRFLYANSDQRPAGAACEVTAPSAHLIAGRVGYAGAVWLHPSVRGRHLFPLIGPVARAYAYTRWQIDVAVGLTSKTLWSKGFAREIGHRNSEFGIGFSNCPGCPAEAALLWTKAESFNEEFVAFLDRQTHVSPSAERLRHA